MLGYLTLFLRLAADYLGGPLLHTLGFQASTSALWVPKSFWDAGPPAEAARHLLHVQHGNGPPAAATSATWVHTQLLWENFASNTSLYPEHASFPG